MAKQLNRKPGQVWRLNRRAYPLSPAVYVLDRFARRQYDYSTQQYRVVPSHNYVMMRPVDEKGSMGAGNIPFSISRNALTTRRGLWTFVGMDDQEERNLVVWCIRCGGADVIKCRYPDMNYICPDCKSK